MSPIAREQGSNLEGLLSVPLRDDGCLPLVEAVNIYDCGVSRSKYPVDASPYVDRRLDGQIDKALLTDPFVLLVGTSRSGKSRTAIEALRRVMPQASLVVPTGDPSAPREISGLEIPTCGQDGQVIWLDDLDRYLAPNGLDLSGLDRISRFRPRTLVIGTIRSDRRAALLKTQGDAGRTARLVLDRATVVNLPRLLTPDERKKAREQYPKEDFTDRGIGEQLVAAPMLEQRYNDGYASDPEGWAVLQAAIDWRRVGLDRPIPEPDLRQLYAPYLYRARPDLDPTDDSIDGGLQWARNPVAGTVALLYAIQSGDSREFKANDYIVAYSDGEGDGAPNEVPLSTWNHLIGSLAPVEVLDLAFEAYTRKEIEIARRASARVLDSDDDASPWAALLMLELAVRDGDLEKAGHFYRTAINANQPRLTALAQVDYGAALLKGGRPGEGRPLLEAAIASGEPEVVPIAQANLGGVLFALGEWDEARAILEKAIASSSRQVVPLAQTNLGSLLAARGNIEEGTALLEAAVASGDDDVVPLAQANLGGLAINAGDFERARTFLEAALLSGNLDAVPMAEANLGGLLALQGDVERGKRLLESAVASGNGQALPLAQANLGGVLAREGATDRAQGLLEAAIASGNSQIVPLAQLNLGIVWLNKNELRRAQSVFETALASGNPRIPQALMRMGGALVSQGQAERAVLMLEAVIASNAPRVVAQAQVILGALMLNQANLGRARELLEAALESGDPDVLPLAQVNLGGLLLNLGEVERARELLEAALLSGIPQVVAMAQANLAGLLVARGDLQRARELLEAAVASGQPEALPLAQVNLGGLLLNLGELDRSQVLLESALESAGPQLLPIAQANLGGLLVRIGELGRAKPLLEAALASGNPFAVPLAQLNLGGLLMSEGAFERAGELLEGALASGNPQVVPLAQGNLGALYLDQGDVDRARPLLEAALDSRNAAVAPLAQLGLGSLLLNQNDLESAQPMLEAAMGSGNPQVVPLAQLNLGVLHLRRGHPELARPLFESMIETNQPERIQAAALLGDLLAEQGDKDGAEAAYQICIASGDAQWAPIARTDLAALLVEDGDLDQAEALLQEVVASDHPIRAQAATLLGNLLVERGDTQGATGAYETSIASGDADWAPIAQIRLAAILAKQGDHDQAQTLLQEVIASNGPNRAQAADNLGDLLAERGDVVGAEAAYKTAIDCGDAFYSPWAEVDLASLLWKQGKLDRAKPLLARAAGSDHPMRLQFTGMVGDLLNALGDAAGAESAYRTAAASDNPGTTTAANTRLAEMATAPDGVVDRGIDYAHQVQLAQQTFLT